MDKDNMTIAEKVSYIKGLAEGLKLDESTNEGRIITAIIDVLGDIALNIEAIDEDLAEVTDVVTDVEEAVYDLEDEVYGEDESEYDDDGEEMYEVTCPNCGNTISADFDVVSGGEIACPNCGELLELNFEEISDDQN